MMLDGSCLCGAVRFSVYSPEPEPYVYCICDLCRKMAGGGYPISVYADAQSLEVKGKDNVATFQLAARNPRDSCNLTLDECRRDFCRHCGSALWLYDPRWPELVHLFASAIETPLPD